MAKIVQRNDWLKEETTNLLSKAMYEDFKVRHHAASMHVKDCNEAMVVVVTEILGAMRVEDKNQYNHQVVKCEFFWWLLSMLCDVLY
jgi:phospholipid-translocating ATPase